MSPDWLREQSLPKGANSTLVVAMTETGKQVGHCFVSQWEHGVDRVWWITQLLVLPEYRSQKRATKVIRCRITFNYK